MSNAPTLTGLTSSVAFNENDVNATPALIDADVVFNDPNADLDGGSLTLTGLLAEDVVSVRNVGTGAGEIGLSGSDITYGGVVIGTLSGGAGTDLTISFNANATVAAVEALLENLTYANTSDMPTASRDLTLNLTDAAGNPLNAQLVVTPRAGADNPLEGVDVDTGFSAPTLGDIDGDGDLDLLSGDRYGRVHFLENTGSATQPRYVQRTGADNPFDAIFGFFFGGGYGMPALADLDGDGDLDLIAGNLTGELYYIENTGTALAPSYQQRTGAANPMDGIDIGGGSMPALVDVDGDGDLDMLVGAEGASPNYFENTGSATAPSFAARTGVANPFDGVGSGQRSSPSFVDVDNDGDADLVMSRSDGTFEFFENTGSATSPSFVRRTGADNPFDGLSVGNTATAAFADIDGDGRLELVAGDGSGGFSVVDLDIEGGMDITVNVTAQDDVALARDDMFSVAETGVLAADVFTDNGAGADSDPEGDPFNVIAVNGSAIGVGQTITLSSGALLTLNADGTFSYDPNGAFDDLAAPGSGAINTGATDSFVYHLTGGARATATIAITGVDSDDWVRGSRGDDVLDGGSGADRYEARRGDDVMMLRAGAASFDGGFGSDRIEVMDNGADLSLMSFTSIEAIDFNGNDVRIDAGQIDGLGRIEGAATITLLTAGASVFGALRSGDGVIEGAAGADDITLTGRQGWTVNTHDGDDVVRGSEGDDAMDGGAGGDRLTGGDGFDQLTGGAGDDIIDGGFKGDVIFGGDGDDTLDGGAGRDTLNGGAGADVIDGGVADDMLAGGAGDDVLTGGAGRDRIQGDDGADRIEGGAGRDILRGGAGSDTFVYTAVSDSAAGGLNRDRIRDFTNEDLIDLSAIDADAGTAGDQAFTFVNAFTGAGGEVMFDASAEMVLIDVDGDSVADMEIDLTGRIGGVTADDFIL